MTASFPISTGVFLDHTLRRLLPCRPMPTTTYQKVSMMALSFSSSPPTEVALDIVHPIGPVKAFQDPHERTIPCLDVQKQRLAGNSTPCIFWRLRRVAGDLQDKYLRSPTVGPLSLSSVSYPFHNGSVVDTSTCFTSRQQSYQNSHVCGTGFYFFGL